MACLLAQLSPRAIFRFLALLQSTGGGFEEQRFYRPTVLAHQQHVSLRVHRHQNHRWHVVYDLAHGFYRAGFHIYAHRVTSNTKKRAFVDAFTLDQFLFGHGSSPYSLGVVPPFRCRLIELSLRDSARGSLCGEPCRRKRALWGPSWTRTVSPGERSRSI